MTEPEEPLTVDDYSTLIERNYLTGDKTALLRMIMYCAVHRRPIPEWAGQAFDLIYRSALAGEIRSWDDVFGRPWGRAGQQRSVRTASWKRQVYSRVRDLHEKGEEGKKWPIDNALFEKVAKEFGIGGRATVAELYGEVERLMRRIRDTEQ